MVSQRLSERCVSGKRKWLAIEKRLVQRTGQGVAREKSVGSISLCQKGSHGDG